MTTIYDRELEEKNQGYEIESGSLKYLIISQFARLHGYRLRMRKLPFKAIQSVYPCWNV